MSRSGSYESFNGLVTGKETLGDEKKLDRHRPEQIVARLLDADPMHNAGQGHSPVLQTLEIAEATCLRRPMKN